MNIYKFDSKYFLDNLNELLGTLAYFSKFKI